MDEQAIVLLAPQVKVLFESLCAPIPLGDVDEEEREKTGTVSLQSLGLGVKSDMGMTRKLENICQGLTLPEKQGEIMRFLANTGNAQRINSLVEDIHEGLMEYQVWMASYSFSAISDLCARLHCNKISTTRIVSSL